MNDPRCVLDRALTRLAPLLARTRPLRPCPGWHFNSGELQAGIAMRVRRRVWDYFRRRKVAAPSIQAWHGGTRVQCYLGNDLSRQLFVSGMYEPNELSVLARALEPGMVFVDGGANEGWFSLLAASRVGPAGKVLAFEPSEREATRFVANMELNGLANVVLIRAALSDQEGSAALRIADDEHAGQNTLGRFVHEVTQLEIRETRLVTLDRVVQDQKLERVDVIKLDVEGAEFKTLKGAQHTLARYRPLLLVEILGPALEQQGDSASSLLALLADMGYRLWWFDPGSGLPTVEDARRPRGDTLVAVHAGRSGGLFGPA